MRRRKSSSSRLTAITEVICTSNLALDSNALLLDIYRMIETKVLSSYLTTSLRHLLTSILPSCGNGLHSEFITLTLLSRRDVVQPALSFFSKLTDIISCFSKPFG